MPMRWITRQFAKVDRIACPWLSRSCGDTASIAVEGKTL
ncbi:MAG: chromate resistance protein ChrB domain-containing protein [Candidatus Binatia bacterium]